MVYFSVFSFMASILYAYVGLRAMNANRRSASCRIFFYLTLSLAIWSFAGGFVYLAQNPVEYSFWNKISAFGWCTFEAFVLYFVLLITQNKQIRHWYVRLLVMAPAGIFLFMALFLFGPGTDTSPAVESFFYTGNFIYNFTYLVLSILLIAAWGRRSESKIRKKQASILVWSSLAPFLLTFLFSRCSLISICFTFRIWGRFLP